MAINDLFSNIPFINNLSSINLNTVLYGVIYIGIFLIIGFLIYKWYSRLLEIRYNAFVVFDTLHGKKGCFDEIIEKKIKGEREPITLLRKLKLPLNLILDRSLMLDTVNMGSFASKGKPLVPLYLDQHKNFQQLDFYTSVPIKNKEGKIIGNRPLFRTALTTEAKETYARTIRSIYERNKNKDNITPQKAVMYIIIAGMVVLVFIYLIAKLVS